VTISLCDGAAASDSFDMMPIMAIEDQPANALKIKRTKFDDT